MMQAISFDLARDPAEFLRSDPGLSGGFHLLYQKEQTQIIAADPLAIYRVAWDCRSVEIRRRGTDTPERVELPGADPFPFLNAQLARFAATHATPDVPFFKGGLIGINSFEGLSSFLKIDSLHPGQVPFVYGLFDNFIVTDLAAQRCHIVFSPGRAAKALALRARLAAWARDDRPALRRRTRSLTEFRAAAADHTDFVARIREGVDRIKPHLTCGNSFQTVLSHELRLPVQRGAYDSFLAMRHHPSAYKYFVQFDDIRIAGISPENLVIVGDGRARMTPLAGTQPRHDDPEAQARSIVALRQSTKEIAEHTMLVDLVRNDLGRICQPGSVEVRAFQYVAPFGPVMHLASDVEGTLSKGVTPLDVMRALSPAGTMTGAPKRRSIQIIRELEPGPRGFYSGNIGFADVSGAGDFAIIIRSAIHDTPREASLRAGMGIVLDSTAAEEAEEWLHKVYSAGKECV